MKKVLLTFMLGLGISGASFANYTYYGPTQFDGSFVNCEGFNFMYCVTNSGPNWTPTPGDLVTIYDNDGRVIGQYVLTSAQISDSSPSDDDQNPEAPEATFQVEKTASVNETSN